MPLASIFRPPGRRTANIWPSRASAPAICIYSSPIGRGRIQSNRHHVRRPMQDSRLVELARHGKERERVKALGVFDIGSNTILITVGRLSSSGSLETLLDEGDVVRLAEGLKDGGALQEEAKARALKALAEFKRGGEQLGVRHFQAA